MFRHGAYTWEDVQVTGWTLQIMTPFMLSVAGINILKKVYYALDDRNTLFWVGAVGVVLTGVLGFVLMPYGGVMGLGAALSMSTVIQCALYLGILWYRLRDDLGFQVWLRPIALIATASLPSAGLLWWFSGWGEWSQGPLLFQNWLVAGLGGFLAVVVYLGACLALGVKEVPKG